MSVHIATVSPAEVQAAVPVAFVDSAGGVPGLLLVFHQQINVIAVFPPHSTRVHWDISTYWFCQYLLSSCSVFLLVIQSICPSMCFMMHKLLVYFPQGFLCLRVPSPFSQQFLPLCAYLLAAARQTTQIHPFNLLPLLSPFCNSSGSFSAGFDDFT